MTEIIKHAKRDKYHPNMIGRGEYEYLNDLYQFKDKQSFLNMGSLNGTRGTAIQLNYDNIVMEAY